MKMVQGALPSQLMRTVTLPIGCAGLSWLSVKSLSHSARRKRGSTRLT
ncbi:hypothetical protein CSC34_5488 [Pseudomonas aeruginosa]|nr:hypothetical protein CSC34_5488 [Pseudomonas aeruginosa]